LVIKAGLRVKREGQAKSNSRRMGDDETAIFKKNRTNKPAGKKMTPGSRELAHTDSGKFPSREAQETRGSQTLS